MGAVVAARKDGWVEGVPYVMVRWAGAFWSTGLSCRGRGIHLTWAGVFEPQNFAETK